MKLKLDRGLNQPRRLASSNFWRCVASAGKIDHL